jgi:hypothetical protein
MKEAMQNRLVQIGVAIVALLVVCCGLLAYVLFSSNSLQSNNNVEQIVQNDACRNEVQVWMGNHQQVLRYQVLSVQEWQKSNVDNAINYYEKATAKYMAMAIPSCDSDAELAHNYKGEELLLLGKSYRETLTGDASMAELYISDANELLLKEKKLLEDINARYQFN